MTAQETLIADGRRALQEGNVDEARELFDAALTHGDSGGALEGLGEAAYLEQLFDKAIELFERAYAAYRTEGEMLRAGHVARNLGWLYAGYRGDGAVMQGWIARAQTLLAEGDTVERGWVEFTLGMFEAAGPKREAHLRASIDTGRRLGDTDLESVALAQLGCSFVLSDRYDEGMMMLDEALAAVMGGDTKEFNNVEIIFCQLFTACEYAHDIARADQWIRLGEDVAKRRRLPAIAAWCRTHYGGLLTAAGRWSEAEEELSAASQIWSDTFTSLRWQALFRLADLRVRQGRLEEASQLLDGLDMYTEAARPLAAIHLARGDTALAVDVIERALTQMEDGSTAAAPLWALMVDIRLAGGAVDEAAAAAGRLEEIAAQHPSHYLCASAALARGRVCLVDKTGDPRACLRDALSGFAHAQMPMELASARLELARALTEDHPEVAITEAKAALDAFERLEAARHTDAAAALLRSLGGPARTGPKGKQVLTKREAEVLELLGHGLSNPEISDRLYISRKTVEHHVGNVLAKLGLRSRAEAAAHAARTGSSAER